MAAGRPIVMTGGCAREMGLVAHGADEARRAVRTMLAEHVDLFKVMAGGGVFPQGEHLDSIQLGVDELTAAVTEAHNNGRPIAAHAHGLSAIKNAIAAGAEGDTPPHRRRRDLPEPGGDHPPGGGCAGRASEEWAGGRRYFGLDVLVRCRLTAADPGGRQHTDLPALESMEIAA